MTGRLLALPDLPRIRAAVVDSSFADLDSMARHQYRFLPERLAALFAGATAFFGWLETGVHTSRVSPLRALDQIDIPLFFLHGTEDTIVPSSSTEKLYAAYKGSKRLRLVEGAKHGGAAAADPFRYQKEVKEFFLEALR